MLQQRYKSYWCPRNNRSVWKLSQTSKKKAAELIVQLKCIYTNAYSIGHKQEELEATVQLEYYDIAITMEGQSNNSGATMAGHKPFTRDKQGQRDGGVASMLGTVLVV